MVEFRVGEDGHPYAVEFSNVSIWPRRPEVPSNLTEERATDSRVKHKPTRSHTMPSPGLAATAQKPLPSIPNEVATRAGSLRRIFRRRFSEPGRRPQIHSDWTLAAPPIEGSAHISTRLGMEDNERWRDPESIAALTLVPEDGPQYEDILPTPETPVRVRSLRRRPPISVLDQISSIIPEASPMLTVPAHKRRQLQEDSDELNIRSGGLHLSFPVGESADLPQKTPTSRLRRLSRTIARAVADAGMISPHVKSDGNRDASPAPEGKSLYKGTYGQVRNALHAAGLVVKKCEEDGFDGAHRVGTLFVANRDVHDNVIFTKIVLYGTC